RCLRAQQGSDRRRIGIDYALSHDRSRLVHHTDRCLLQRHVQSNIVHHCCSPSLRGHIKMASYVAGELIPWAFVWLSIPELPHVAKVRNCPALIFLLKKNPPDDRRSMWPQSRYRGRQRVFLQTMRSPTYLHASRLYSQKKF